MVFTLDARACIRVLAIVLILWLVGSGAPAVAQLPAGTKFVATDLRHNLLTGWDAKGSVTTLEPLLHARLPISLTMDETNQRVLVWDLARMVAYDLRTGAETVTTLVGHSEGPGFVDGDGSMVWCAGVGEIYRAADTRGTGITRIFHRPNEPTRFVGICWNGSTGGFVAHRWSKNGTVEFFARDGTRSLIVKGFDYASGCDWCPWTGDIVVSTQGGGLYRVDQSGRRTTIVESLLLGGANGVEAMHQATPPGPAFVVIGANHTFGASLATVTDRGVITTLHRDNALVLTDVEIVRSRTLWAGRPWLIGGRGPLHLDMGARHAGDAYQIALSFSHRPGISLGAGHLHLAPDSLFFASARSSPAALFKHFSGVLNSAGQPSVRQPWVEIPSAARLRGLRIFGGAVTYRPSGVTGVTGCWGTTIR